MKFKVIENGNKVWVDTRDVGLEMTFKQIENIYISMKKKRDKQ